VVNGHNKLDGVTKLINYSKQNVIIGVHIVFTGFDDPIQLNCGESNKNYTIGWTETNATVLMPEIGIEKGDDISVWACKGDSCDPTSVSCYDSNGTFVKELLNEKKCGFGVSHCTRYGNLV
jgi:hypothetical protein